MDVLLIGGTGIISSEVCKRLLDNGHCVTIINRGKRGNMLDSRAKLIIADVRHESVNQISSKVEDRYDVVVDFITYNVEQLVKSLSIFSTKCTQYIFISSATVYQPYKGLYTESCAVGNEAWDYSLRKSECENYLKSNSNNIKCVYTIVRPYITYGKTRMPYQFCPIEYYTLLKRIEAGKPLPILGNGIKCTLTFSPDFAVGLVGLMLNEKAYGESFHITASDSLTWEDVAYTIGKNIGKEVELVAVSSDLLNKYRDFMTFDVDEILGDKGRNMEFDNRKIRDAVPDFNPTSSFSECILETIKYLETTASLQKVNYAWDASIDFLLSESPTIGKLKHRLNFANYGNETSLSDLKRYYSNRYYSIVSLKKRLRK